MIADMEQLTSLLDSLSLSQDRLAVLESVRPALGKLSRLTMAADLSPCDDRICPDVQSYLS